MRFIYSGWAPPSLGTRAVGRDLDRRTLKNNPSDMGMNLWSSYNDQIENVCVQKYPVLSLGRYGHNVWLGFIHLFIHTFIPLVFGIY